MKKGFTLLELLITLGVLTIIGTTAVLVVNPVEYIKQSRDARRVGDIKAIDDAIASALANSPNIAQGAAQTVYVSLPDTATNCPTLGSTLPTLPAGWSYYCASQANYRKTNGTGWMPINFDGLPAKSPLTTLPIDPKNDASAGLYYVYITGGSYAVSAALESEKHLAGSAAKDTGLDPARIEQGSDLLLLANAAGLVGYWPLDEGSGTVARDASGEGHNGTLSVGAPAWTTGKIGNAVRFNGSSGVNVPGVGTADFSNGMTMSAWFNPAVLAANTNIFASFGLPYLSAHVGNKGFYSAQIGGTQRSIGGTNVLSINNWYFIVGTYDGSSMKIYVNGELEGILAMPGTQAVSPNLCIGAHSCTSYWTNGNMDDVRIYNRPLTAPEIRAMYRANK